MSAAFGDRILRGASRFPLLQCALAALALGSAGSPACADDFVDAGTELQFPEKIKGWKRTEVHEYESAELGRSIEYSHPRHGALSFYIYTGGFTDLPDGGDSAAVKQTIENVGREIHQRWTHEGAIVEDVWPPHRVLNERNRGACGAWTSVHRIHLDDRVHTSLTVVSAYRGHLLKVRFTRPGDVFATRASLATFLRALQAHNRDALPPWLRATEWALEPPAGDASAQLQTR